MNLGSLLNAAENVLTFEELQDLAKKDDDAVLSKLVNIKSLLPPKLDRPYEYFDVFISILARQYTDTRHDIQYIKSATTDALRSCIDGLLQRYGLEWLLHFPQHMSAPTWRRFHALPDTTVLVYLYGLVLALKKKEDIPTETWAKALSHFARALSPAVMLHIWLNLVAIDADQPFQAPTKPIFIAELDYLLVTAEKDATVAVMGMLQAMASSNTNFLVENIDQQLGSILLRPPSTKDEMTLAGAAFQNEFDKHPAVYPHLAKVLAMFRRQLRMQNKKAMSKTNPLLSNTLTDLVADVVTRMSMVHKGTLSWIHYAGRLQPFEFDMFLEELIRQLYPTNRKTNLDLVLADWAARDPFRCHMDIIMDATIDLFRHPTGPRAKPYNKRAAPFYAFIQMFSIPGEHRKDDEKTAYKIKTGAEVDMSQFYSSTDMSLVHGCCRLLKHMTLSGHPTVHEWLVDCLRSAVPDILQWYLEWIARGLNAELASGEASTCFQDCARAILSDTSTISLPTCVVPPLLGQLTDASLVWLLQMMSKPNVIMTYFSQGPQMASKMVVHDLLQSCSHEYMSYLMSYLGSTMDGTDSGKRSRTWFKDHFLEMILSLAGQDESGTSTASQILFRLLKNETDFMFYFATPLNEDMVKMSDIDRLDISKARTILSVRYTGLAYMIQELVRLEGSPESERLVHQWSSLWINVCEDREELAVPVRWVLLCIGLYDQAPALVKQMIERLMTLGHCQAASQDASDFICQVMELVMLSDSPEADEVFDLFLQVYKQIHHRSVSGRDIEDIESCILFVLVELTEEFGLELRFPSAKTVVASDPQADEMASVVTVTKSRHLKKALKKKLRKNKKYRGQAFFKALVESEPAPTATSMKGVVSTFNPTLEPTSPGTMAASKNALTVLIQRSLNFLLTIFTTTDKNSLCAAEKHDLKSRLAMHLALYEPLGTLSGLIEQEEMREDIQIIIDSCLECLGNDSGRLEMAKRVLGLKQFH